MVAPKKPTTDCLQAGWAPSSRPLGSLLLTALMQAWHPAAAPPGAPAPPGLQPCGRLAVSPALAWTGTQPSCTSKLAQGSN